MCLYSPQDHADVCVHMCAVLTRGKLTTRRHIDTYEVVSRYALYVHKESQYVSRKHSHHSSFHSSRFTCEEGMGNQDSHVRRDGKSRFTCEEGWEIKIHM